jgi:hypothetical protein
MGAFISKMHLIPASLFCPLPVGSPSGFFGRQIRCLERGRRIVFQRLRPQLGYSGSEFWRCFSPRRIL